MDVQPVEKELSGQRWGKGLHLAFLNSDK